MPNEYRGDAFLLSWTDGRPAANDLLTPLLDPGQDMLQLRLTNDGENYRMASRRIVRGFHLPIDAAIIGAKIYVLDLGGAHMIWEIDLSAASSVPSEAGAETILTSPYPNPASGETQFTIAVPRTQRVTVEVRNILGDVVATLHDGVVAADLPRWLTLDCGALPRGSYIISARGETFYRSERISVVR